MDTSELEATITFLRPTVAAFDTTSGVAVTTTVASFSTTWDVPWTITVSLTVFSTTWVTTFSTACGAGAGAGAQAVNTVVAMTTTISRFANTFRGIM